MKPEIFDQHFDQLRDEYNGSELWSTCLTDYVPFYSIIEWLSDEENADLMRRMIKAAEDMK